MGDPLEEWRRLREKRGDAITVIDLYELVATPLGLKPEQLPIEQRQQLAIRAQRAIDPEFAIAPDSEREDAPIELVPYDPAWPQRYELWKRRLLAALGPERARIEHVGSTAVPGLAAKPVIDVQVSEPDVEDEDAYVDAIESIGVQLRIRDAQHRFFRPFAGRPRDVHIHVCAAGGEWERRHLLFVAYLKRHADARRRYLEAKQRAAERWADDRVAYTDAKTQTVLELLAVAETWAKRTGWSTETRPKR